MWECGGWARWKSLSWIAFTTFTFNNSIHLINSTLRYSLVLIGYFECWLFLGENCPHGVTRLPSAASWSVLEFRPKICSQQKFGSFMFKGTHEYFNYNICFIHSADCLYNQDKDWWGLTAGFAAGGGVVSAAAAGGGAAVFSASAGFPIQLFTRPATLPLTPTTSWVGGDVL